MNKLFYRIGTCDSKQGLWYKPDGTFTGDIHSKYNFCKNANLQMPYDENIAGYLSATDSLGDLFNWFPMEDILELQKFGFKIFIYEAEDFKVVNNHFVINQKTSKIFAEQTLYGLGEFAETIVKEGSSYKFIKD